MQPPDIVVAWQRGNIDGSYVWQPNLSKLQKGGGTILTTSADLAKRVSACLDMVGLVHAAYLLPHQLSGGMQPRAAIARTLAAEPQLILMDEPFGALDALIRESMQLHLKGIWQRTHKTIFFITHDVEEALLLATRIIVMHACPGRIVHDVVNPFVHQLGSDSAAKLRLSREFVEMQEFLVNSIRDLNPASVGVKPLHPS